MDPTAMIRANGEAWNAIAPMRHGEPPEFFVNGGSALDPIEIELAGDVRGARALQLACSTGDEVISWSMLGAIASGIDISQVHIDKAIAKAAAVGVECDLRCGDMFALPVDLIDLDLIHISWGGVNWAPDIGAWARIVAARLRPGGAVLISEMHPLWFTLSVTGDNALTVRADYFERAAIPTTWDPSKEPVGGRDRDAPVLRSFVWSLGAMVTALLAAGLRIDALQEHPDPENYAGLGTAAGALPAVYYLKATRI
jgi:SAM-dependent methyltransferase